MTTNAVQWIYYRSDLPMGHDGIHHGIKTTIHIEDASKPLEASQEQPRQFSLKDLDFSHLSALATVSTLPLSQPLPPAPVPDPSQETHPRHTTLLNTNSTETNHNTTTNNTQIVCSHGGCGQTFSSASNRKRHELLHLQIKPHICTECQRPFSRSYDLKVHRRIHTHEKPYECSVSGCSKRFSRSSTLREHERNVHHQKRK